MLFAAAALFSAAFVSCSKGGEEGLEDGQYIEEAAKYELKTPVDLGGYTVEEIEFTPDGDAIITKEVSGNKTVDIKPYSFSKTKAGDGTYTITGFGTVVVSDGTSLTITVSGGTGQTVSANVIVSGSGVRNADDDLFHTWKVTRTIILVKGGNLGSNGAGKTFNGLNAEDIAKYIANDLGVNIDTDACKGYTVKTISLNPTGTIAIAFSDASKNYLGTWSISGNSMSYSMSVGVGNDIINASAKGTAEVSGKKCELIINGTFTVNSTTYTTNIELTLEQA